MKVAYWTNCLSPHQLPLAKAIASRVGDGNYAYLYRDELYAERRRTGWDSMEIPSWCARACEDSPLLADADLVYTGGLRPLNLFARRIAAGKPTYYVTERWFKPLQLFGINLPGRWRMLLPTYRLMAKTMVSYLNNPLCRCLAIGPWAKKDMLCLGVKPEQIVDWGYFVERGEPSFAKASAAAQALADKSDGERGATLRQGYGWRAEDRALRVLWVGRMLKWKRVDTIIRAIGELSARINASSNASIITLDIYGTGPEEQRLKKLAKGYKSIIKFHPSVSIGDVRKLMREHDIFVLASDENEGWGAVVNEALEEGMKVIGTHEAGSSAAMLPKERLFSSGDTCGLVRLLEQECLGELPECSIGDWIPEKAGERILELLMSQTGV